MAINTQLNTATVPNAVFTTTVTLSSANIQAMNTAGILLIAAQGANTCIMIHDVFNEYIFNTTGYADGDPPQLQYGNTGADSNATPIFSYLSNIFTGSSSSFYGTNGSDGGGVSPLAASGAINTGVYISNFTAPYSGGNSTAKITLTYSVITTTS
jgi:hypothetical protein